MANELKSGAWLRAERRRRCLSQEDLAELLGTRVGTVSLWERDVQVPRLRTLRLIAEVMRISTEEVGAAFSEVQP